MWEKGHFRPTAMASETHKGNCLFDMFGLAKYKSTCQV